MVKEKRKGTEVALFSSQAFPLNYPQGRRPPRKLGISSCGEMSRKFACIYFTERHLVAAVLCLPQQWQMLATSPRPWWNKLSPWYLQNLYRATLLDKYPRTIQCLDGVLLRPLEKPAGSQRYCELNPANSVLDVDELPFRHRSGYEVPLTLQILTFLRNKPEIYSKWPREFNRLS